MNDYEKYTIDQIDYNIKRVNEILNGKFNDFTREIDTLYICCKKLDDLVDDLMRSQEYVKADCEAMQND